MQDNSLQKQMQEITDKLEAGIKDLFQSERYKEYLNTMSKFHNYSLNNMLLINMQKPDASLVAGYAAWQKNHERHVRKGEKAIKIFAPVPYTVKAKQHKIDPVTKKAVLDKDGKPEEITVEVNKLGFRLVSVFDVSQTEGKELPTIGAVELSGDVTEYESFFEALKDVCPVPIEFEKIQSGAKGYYHLQENRIAIKEGMSQIQTIKTAIHEMAHQKLHAIEKPENEPDRQLTARSREVEAESVAFAVCQHYGIDTSDYSFSYIASWSSGKDTPELKESLDVIRKAASEMINSIDEKLQERRLQIENQKQTGHEQKDNIQKPSVLNNLHQKQEQLRTEIKSDSTVPKKEAVR